MIRTWHIIISGYTQTEGRLHGCQRLWLDMMQLANPRTVVIQPAWNHDFSGLASRIQNASASDRRVLVYAYSWGCGNGLIKLAAELRSRAIDIDHAVLSDPVYHSQKFESWPGVGHLMRGLGVLMQRKIAVPLNVRRIDWFRQTENIPKGCDLSVAANTKLSNPVVLDYPHEAMDDAPEWHKRCLEVAGVVDA